MSERKQWAEIGRALGLDKTTCTGMSNHVKTNYYKWIHPYEEYIQKHQSDNFEKTHTYEPAEQKHQSSRMNFRAQTHSTNNNPSQLQTDCNPESQPYVNTAQLNDGDVPETAVQNPAKPSNPRSDSMEIDSDQSKNMAEQLLGLDADSGLSNIDGDMSSSADDQATKPAEGTSDETGRRLPRRAARSNAKTILESPVKSTTRKRPDESAKSVKRMKFIKKGLFGKVLFAKGGEVCVACEKTGTPLNLIICDDCERPFHLACLDPILQKIPVVEWCCLSCLKRHGVDYGFVERSAKRNLSDFQTFADEFKRNWFKRRFNKFKVTERECETEFWKLIHSPYEDVEVEYGADLHSSLHGRYFYF